MSPDSLVGEVELAPDLPGRFEEDGFALVEGALGADALAAVRPAVAQVAGASSQAEVPMRERGTYQQAFIQEVNLWQRFAAVRPLVCSPRLARMAADLMGVDGVRLYHDQALVKEAGGGRTPWHCDQHYWPIGSDRMVTAWIPLHDVPLSMGPLRFSTGSHRVDLGRELAIGDESDAAVRHHPRWRELPVWEQPVAAGDVTFHQGWTFHGAGPNETARDRMVFTVIYVTDGAPVVEPRTDGQRFDRQIWLPDTEVGEAVGSWLNPLLWHRDGSHAGALDRLPEPTTAYGTFGAS